MASRRVLGIVALCAAVAVTAIVGGTVLLSRNESTTLPARPGKPVLQLELGLPCPDAEACALQQAQALLDQQNRAAQAAAIFRRYSSPEARLGLAFSQWTGPASLATVKAIAAAYPHEPSVLLNLGWADYQAGRNADAVAAWQQTVTGYPDSPYAVDAADALHPTVVPGLPPIIVDPAAVPSKARADLVAGLRLWNRLKHVVSARRKLDAAARLAPRTPETLVAAAVARFSPAEPLAPFPQLGPLTATFAGNSMVRLHLGVLLLWSRQVTKGKAQLRMAAAEQPKSIYARQARLLLHALAKNEQR